MSTLAINASWGEIDFKASGLQELIIRNPKEAGRQFTDFLKNGGRINIPELPFPIWKIITIGGIPKDKLLKQLKAGSFFVGDSAKKIMSKPEFTTAKRMRSLKLSCCQVMDLGFTTSPTIDILFARIKEVAWLCPAEGGPHLCLQLKNLADGEELLIAMDPIIVSDLPLVFSIRRDSSGEFYRLTDVAAGPNYQYALNGKIVFATRN